MQVLAGSQETLGIPGRKGIGVNLPAWYHEPKADKKKLRAGRKT